MKATTARAVLPVQVPITSWLTASTWRTLDEFAQANGTTVGDVLARIADRAVAKPLDTQILELRAQGMKPGMIAATLGIDVKRVYWVKPSKARS